MRIRNKFKQAEYARKHYLNNIERMKQRALAFKSQTRKNLRDLTDRLKSKPCADCNGTFPPYVMDFDHVNGNKKENIADLISKAVSKKKLFNEISKCEVVCANCHRIRTHKRNSA